jgi:maleate isomerase
MNAKRQGKWRRIGLLLPSANLVMEADFYRNLPENITVHTTRMYLPETTVEGEEKMLDEFVLPAARTIENVKPDVVVFGCTSAGALRGKQYEEGLIQTISKTVHAPVVSVMSAVKEDMDRAGVKRLVVVTPYVQTVNERIAGSLMEDGFEVLNITGLGINHSIHLGEVPGEKIVEFTRQSVQGFQPEGVFISCTNFQAMSVLSILIKELPFPVFSSNQSTYNKVLETLRNSN